MKHSVFERFTQALLACVFLFVIGFVWHSVTTPVRAGTLSNVQAILSKTSPSTTQTNMQFIFTVTSTMSNANCDFNAIGETCFRIRLAMPVTSTAGYGWGSAFQVAPMATSTNYQDCNGSNADVCVHASGTGYLMGHLAVLAVVTSSNPANGSTAVYPDTLDIYIGSGTTVYAGTQIYLWFYNGKFTTPGFKPGHQTGEIDFHGIGIETSKCRNWNGSTCVESVDYDNAVGVVTIMDPVTFSASVDESLQFIVRSVATGTIIGTYEQLNPTMGSATSSCAFGTLAPFVPKTCAHRLEWLTSAQGGAAVYVVQDANLRDGQADIDQFNNGLRLHPGAAVPWVSPSADPSSESTWGHLGYAATSTDAAVTSYGAFQTGPNFGGILVRPDLQTRPSDIFPAPNKNASIAYTTGPNTSLVHAYVVYRVEISPLQEAGDYQNEIQYQIVAQY